MIGHLLLRQILLISILFIVIDKIFGGCAEVTYFSELYSAIVDFYLD